MKNAQQLLEKAVGDILEKFAFMFSEIVPPADFYLDEALYHHATIRFEGPCKGSIGLAAGAGFCTQLAANILGEEAGSLQALQSRDALKELLNVTCGEFLVHAGGPQAVFNLSVPVLEPLAKDQMQDLADEPGVTLLRVDNLPVLIHSEIRP